MKPLKLIHNKKKSSATWFYLINFLITVVILNFVNSNLVLNIGQSSAIVDTQNKIAVSITIISQINNNLKITIDNTFSLVLDDGNATDNKLSPCYLSGLPINCQVTVEGSKHALTFSDSLF